MISEKKLIKLIELINSGRSHEFYYSSDWINLRLKVLSFDNFECQLCKSKGKFKKAVVVHHIQHLKDRPDLSLSVYDDNGNRQLISLCKACHEAEHPERFKNKFKSNNKITNERWD